jgi:hypothetical protein
MTAYVQTLLRAADRLAAGRGLDYRERLQLERAVLRLTSADAMRAFGWVLNSMYPSARDELAAHCQTLGIGATSIANADPYVLNENISRVVHRYSAGVATLPSALRNFAAAHSQPPGRYAAVAW